MLFCYRKFRSYRLCSHLVFLTNISLVKHLKENEGIHCMISIIIMATHWESMHIITISIPFFFFANEAFFYLLGSLIIYIWYIYLYGMGSGLDRSFVECLFELQKLLTSWASRSFLPILWVKSFHKLDHYYRHESKWKTVTFYFSISRGGSASPSRQRSKRTASLSFQRYSVSL